MMHAQAQDKLPQRDALRALLAALRDFDPKAVQEALQNTFAADALIRMCHPFGDLSVGGFWKNCLAPLHTALPDIERRDIICIGGSDEEGKQWVGLCGSYIGTFCAPFLDIPPTGHLVHLRFHEFYQIEGARVVQMQGIWDLPELMMQAGAWPMAPSLGREWHIPAPSTQDGLAPPVKDAAHSTRSQSRVVDMLMAMMRHPREDASAMQLEQYWHPKMTWYGPAGIGTARGIEGFRHWHQIPFLNAMPDRGQYPYETKHHFFAQGDYVAVTGWPNMAQTLSGDGWLGIVPKGQKITLRSLDFWRLEGDKIRENWVLVDLLDMYHQLGVDVLARLREFNKARTLAPLAYPVGGAS